MPLVPITDPDDPRIAPYRAVRERDLKRDDGLFVAEGVVVLRHLLEGERFDVHSVLLAAPKTRPIADRTLKTRPTTPVYVAETPLIDVVAGYPVHRGVLALGRRRVPPDDLDTALDALPERALVLVASAISNHDNVGALFRNAAAFGVHLVVLDGFSCDPLYRKAIRVSVGAALRVPFVHGGGMGDILDALEARRIVPLALSPRGAEDVAGLVRPARAALVVGAEGPGLSREILARARTVTIPMAAGFDSLNVATAAAIALHRLARA